MQWKLTEETNVQLTTNRRFRVFRPSCGHNNPQTIIVQTLRHVLTVTLYQFLVFRSFIDECEIYIIIIVLTHVSSSIPIGARNPTSTNTIHLTAQIFFNAQIQEFRGHVAALTNQIMMSSNLVESQFQIFFINISEYLCK